MENLKKTLEDELIEKRDDESNKVKKGINKSIELTKEIEKDIEKIEKSLIDKKPWGGRRKRKEKYY